MAGLGDKVATTCIICTKKIIVHLYILSANSWVWLFFRHTTGLSAFAIDQSINELHVHVYIRTCIIIDHQLSVHARIIIDTRRRDQQVAIISCASERGKVISSGCLPEWVFSTFQEMDLEFSTSQSRLDATNAVPCESSSFTIVHRCDG